MTESRDVAVSVIIPTHNRDGFLREAVESVLCQTYLPAEIVVVDDQQRSETEALVRQFSLESSLAIYYCSLPPVSTGSAGRSRNAGVRQASGEMLAFLDDDDIWDPTYLEKMLHAARETQWAVSWASFLRNDELRAGQEMPASLSAADAYWVNPGMTGSNTVLGARLFSEIGGFDENLWVSNDRDFLIRLLEAGFSYAVVPERLVLQRSHGEGQLTNRTPRRAAGLRRFILKYDAKLSRRDRRYLRRELASVERVAGATRFTQFRYLLVQILSYTPAELLSTMQEKRGQEQLY